MRVLFLPVWYPTNDNPITGNFIREHAKAASLYNDICVLYVSRSRHPRCNSFYIISDSLEYGIRTIRFEYGGPLFWILHKLDLNKVKSSTKHSASNKSQSIIVGLFKQLISLAGISLNIIHSLIAFHYVLQTKWKPELINAHVFTVGLPAIILGRLYKIPVIITEHYTGFIRRNLTFMNRLHARFALNRADIVLPVSNGLKQAIQAYGIQNRFVVVPNTVNTDIYYPISSQNAKNPEDMKKLLLVSILTTQKGVQYLLEVLHDISQERQDFQLDIVGDGPNRAEYEKQTYHLGLERVIKFHGRITKEKVGEYMRRCDFFVQPSLFETFGVVYIEAMACGKPVIGTNITGPKEIITKEVGILIPPRDLGALKRAILYMLDNYQSYSSEKISQYAKERFSYQVVGKQLDQVYQQAINK